MNQTQNRSGNRLPDRTRTVDQIQNQNQSGFTSVSPSSRVDSFIHRHPDERASATTMDGRQAAKGWSRCQ